MANTHFLVDVWLEDYGYVGEVCITVEGEGVALAYAVNAEIDWLTLHGFVISYVKVRCQFGKLQILAQGWEGCVNLDACKLRQNVNGLTEQLAIDN